VKTSKVYVLVTGALLLLLGITVGVAFINLGAMNTVVAMSISVVKGSLIVLFFMHVRQAVPLVRIFVVAGFFWLGILLVLALSDFLTR
jgi:cytochrome c oxidase subunit 4